MFKHILNDLNIEPNKIDTFLNAYNKSLSIEGEFELQNGKEVTMADVLVDEKASASNGVETEALKNDITFIVGKKGEGIRNIAGSLISMTGDYKTQIEEMRADFAEAGYNELAEEINKKYGLE